MRIIAKRTLKEYWLKHKISEVPLILWHDKTKKAEWENLADLKKDFASADYVGNSRFVFNIKGNDYRLVAKIDFEFGVVYIKFIGTHAEYDKINAKNI